MFNSLQHTIFWAVIFVANPAYCADEYGMAAMSLKMGTALLIVVGLILVLYALAVKKIIPHQKTGKYIQILEMRHMMHKSSLALVKVRDTELLLSISPNGIQRLAELEKDSTQKEFAELLDENQ
ncbi:FliO/MopB family protein [Desulfogranum japonicum]|uniref:FliO/MopB family protein n=1 Tax=Desulfogranum japonicum TaxID=231447 RepID=UPI00040BEA33|nr:flagellar biosynthetic protein FliO [Desulfogranum japonicum]